MLSQSRQFDRFIPNRSCQNFQQCSSQSKENQSFYGNFIQQNICPMSRILNFSNKNNCQLSYSLKRNQSKNKVCLNSSKDLFQSYQSWGSKTGYKKLRSSNENQKILDVPCIKDDFYLNILDWSPLGPLAVALDNQAYLYTPSYIMELCKLLDGAYISSLKFYDTTLSIGHSDGKIRIYDLETNQVIRQISQHNKRVAALSFCSRNILYSGSKDKNVLVNDIRIKDATINRLNAHKGEICALQCQPGAQNFMASGSNDNNVAIWDIRTHRLVKKYTQHKGAVKAISWCPWKIGVIATAGGAGDRTIRLWSVNENQELACKKTESQISSLQWSNQTGLLISGHGLPNNNIRFWKPQFSNNQALNLEKMKELNGHTGRILKLAMSPAQNMICSISADETLRFWRFVDSQNDPWKSQQDRGSRWSIKLK